MQQKAMRSRRFGMYKEETRRGAGWLPVLVALVLAYACLGVLALSAGSEPGDDGEEVELRGVVLAAPGGISGEWLVRGGLDSNAPPQDFLVTTTAATRFDDGLPGVGQRVRVRGKLTGPVALLADEVDREDDGSPGEEIETKGQVIARPADPSGIGQWQILPGSALALTVTVDAQTRLPLGIPALGQWVEVNGQWQTDGSLLARHMRVDEFEADELIVRMLPGIAPEALAARHPITPVQSILAAANIHLFASTPGEEIEQELVQAINSQDKDIVAWAEVNFARGIPEGNPYDIWEWGGQEASGYIHQFAFDQILLNSWGITATGAGMVVAVLDSGVSQSHPDLAALLLPGRDLVDNDAMADDEPGGPGWGHGTHVAGIIAHIAPQSQILPVRVLNPLGRGNSFDVAAGLEWAVQQGADVINLSLGSDSDSRLLRDAVAWVTEQGVVVVAAAGNTNSSLAHFPAAYPAVVAVTGVDAQGAKASFANYSTDWVDVAAPGVGITSTIVGPLGNGYAGWSGTSMAAAFVSGAMALERQRYPQASVAELGQWVKERAISLDGLNPNFAGALGGGLLDVRALLAVSSNLIFAPQLQR